MWKRKGTDCQNQPEVHQLLQALRAVGRIAAPAVAFKAEAIVSPEQLVTYLGTGRHEGKECDLAYNNVLMALLWSALASGRVALMTHALDGMPAVPPGAGWVTYVRCHDDIGWAITPRGCRGRGRGRAPAPALPVGLLCRRVPRVVRPRRALPARRGLGRGAHERDGRVAGRARDGAGERRRGRARAGDPARAPALRDGLRARRAPAHLHGRRARAAQRSGVGRRRAPARRQPLDAPPADGLGGRRAPPRRGLGPGRDLGRPAPAHLRAARHAGDARPQRRTAAVDRQRSRLRPAADLRRRTAAGPRELQPPTSSGSTAPSSTSTG